MNMSKILLGITSAVAVAGIAWGGYEHHGNGQISMKLAQNDSALSGQTAALTSKDTEIADLKATLDQVTGALTNSTARLANAKRKLADYKAQLATLQMSQSEKADRQKLAAEVPITRSGDTVIFPRLLSPHGTTLMENAEFIRTFGRKLIFKKDLEYATFDVDDVHPGVLIQLNLDAQSLIEAQAGVDQKNSAWTEGNAEAAAAKLRSDGRAIREQLRSNAGQVPSDGHRHEGEFQGEQQARIDRVEAQAELIRARAAVADALNNQ
jgi:hypothetical protein